MVNSISLFPISSKIADVFEVITYLTQLNMFFSGLKLAEDWDIFSWVKNN